MKIYLLLIMLSFSAYACKSKKAMASDPATNTITAQAAAPGNTTGKVSHQYRPGGCATVIIVAQEEGEEMVLIPKDKLSKEFDVDGMDIRFNYTVLKMPQPEGCTKGMPATISDISKK